MTTAKKTALTFVFTLTALILSGCGGGSNSANPAAGAVAGNCAPGTTYSPQYGCMPYGNTMTVSSCPTQPGQPPLVRTQYGCLAQGNCPVGQGSLVQNGVVQCLQAIPDGYPMAGSGCPVSQVMTSRGCLPQHYCPVGSGYFQGRCISAVQYENTSNSDQDDYCVRRSHRSHRRHIHAVGLPRIWFYL